MDDRLTWWGGLSVLCAAAISGIWAYVRPVPRAVCEERHRHLSEDVAEIKAELLLLRADQLEILALLSDRRSRASAAAKRAFAFRLKAGLDHGP